MIGYIALINVIVLHSSVAILYSNTPGGRAVIFSNRFKNLAWPIKTANDLTSATWHGVHCAIVIKNCFQHLVTDIELKHHAEHCRRRLVENIKFFEQTPDYQVHPIICKDIRNIFLAYRPIIFLPIGVYFTFDGSEALDETGEFAEIEYNKFFSSHPELVGNDDIFNVLGSINSGNIHSKAERNFTLTKEEAEHLALWNSDQTTRLSSLALYCIEGDGKSLPIEVLKTYVNTKCL